LQFSAAGTVQSKGGKEPRTDLGNGAQFTAFYACNPLNTQHIAVFILRFMHGGRGGKRNEGSGRGGAWWARRESNLSRFAGVTLTRNEMKRKR
jgi:hypothetical protein